MENGREGGVGSGMGSETSVEAGDTEEWSGEHVDMVGLECIIRVNRPKSARVI